MNEQKPTRLQRLVLWLAKVTAVPVGKEDDGLTRMAASSAPNDRSYAEVLNQYEDAMTAWRTNPLARRMIGLITSYCIGDGIRLNSTYRPLARFINDFWDDPLNQIDLEVAGWSDELARSGELFLVLFRNPVSGMTYVRARPAALIEYVECDPDDYKVALRYKERTAPGDPEKWWLSPHHPAAQADRNAPVMLHYAVNRPVGAVRGESDLGAVLIWLRRYGVWLEDRVRLNAGVRAFLWVVKAPTRMLNDLRERYRTPPEPGSVVIADADGESWEAVSPNLHAADARHDGRAIRWMIAAGGPGTALTDFGEGEDANLATAKAMGEQKRRFLRRRQRYIIHMLSDLVLHAYARKVGLGTRTGRRMVTMGDIVVHAPDISPEDNNELATATQALAQGLVSLADLMGDGPMMRALALRLFVKFAGEQLGAEEFAGLVREADQQAEERADQDDEDEE